MLSEGRPLDGGTLRELFEQPAPLSFGVEEEILIVEPQSSQPLPCASELLELLGGQAAARDGRAVGEAGAGDGGASARPVYKLELPAAQLEIVTPPRATVAELSADLRRGRAELMRRTAPRAAFIAAGVHPSARGEAVLNGGGHYLQVGEEYGAVARRQLVCGLHVHVRVSGAERALAVYNELRAHLPELAALAANGAVYEGADSGLASVRPLISGCLPRQGVPPAYESWEELAGDLAWGNAAGRLEGLAGWWWELRPHADLGTIEIRVPDAQAGVEESGAVVAVAAALAAALAERHEAEGLPAPAAGWRIAENRWSAARHGLDGTLTDVRSGRRRPTRERLAELIEELAPAAAAIEGSRELAHAREMLEGAGAERQRELHKQGGCEAVLAWLRDRFEAALSQR